MTIDKFKEDARNKIDSFIKEWCGNHVAHLLDDDENDGEKLREDISHIINQVAETVKENERGAMRKILKGFQMLFLENKRQKEEKANDHESEM